MLLHHNNKILRVAYGFPGGSDGKESACNAGDRGSIPGLGRFPWRKEWAAHSSILAWRSPWTVAHQVPLQGGHGPWGRKESDTTERFHFHFLSFPQSSCIVHSVKNLTAVQETWVQSLGQEDLLKKEMATHPVFLPGGSHGQRSLAGYSP